MLDLTSNKHGTLNVCQIFSSYLNIFLCRLEPWIVGGKTVSTSSSGRGGTSTPRPPSPTTSPRTRGARSCTGSESCTCTVLVLYCTVLYFTVLYCTVTVQVRGAAADPRPRGGADGLHRLARQSRRQRDPRGAQVPRFRRQGRVLW